jgi:hypothetical protein
LRTLFTGVSDEIKDRVLRGTFAELFRIPERTAEDEAR